MTEKTFVLRRNSAWNEFSVLIRGNKNELKTGAVSFIRLFREITQDLNTAKANGYNPEIIERLNALVNEGNQILYKWHEWPLKSSARFILFTFPQKVRLHWKGILASLLIFYGITFFFAVLCLAFPDITAELLPARELRQIESMYNPSNSGFVNPRSINNDADMFGFYIYNNISIAFRTFAGGIFAGFGSLLILCINAGFLGIVAGHLTSIGYAQTFFPFVIAHSAFELNAVAFCAYAGLLLGYRFFITNGLSRGESIKKAGHDALPIIAGSALMLVIAAFLESFWSSKYLWPVQFRIGSGICFWALLLFYFLFAGRGRNGETTFKQLRNKRKNNDASS